VTCPTTRIRSAIIAQAAATAGLLTGGRVQPRRRYRRSAERARHGREVARGRETPAAVTIIAELFTGEQLTYHDPQADLIKLYRDEGGGGRPVQGGIKGCWAPDAGQARDHAPAVAERQHSGRVRAAAPAAAALRAARLARDRGHGLGPCGPDPGPYVKAIRAYQEAGFDEVYLSQIGGRLEGAFDFLATQVLPQVRGT
jgi:hypothetical protein